MDITTKSSQLFPYIVFCFGFYTTSVHSQYWEVRSDVVDKIITKLKHQASYPFDSNGTSLPDADVRMSPLFSVSLINGRLYGFQNLKRIGDGYIHRDPTYVTINALIGLSDVQFTYEAVANYIIFSPNWNISGHADLIAIDFLFDLWTSGEKAGKVKTVTKLDHRVIDSLQVDSIDRSPLRRMMARNVVLRQISDIVQKKLSELKKLLEGMEFQL